MAANRQTDRHTDACAQCSHASVGLAQARPNNQHSCQMTSTKLSTKNTFGRCNTLDRFKDLATHVDLNSITASIKVILLKTC